MSAKLYKKVELFANLAIIVVAVLLGYFLVQKFIFPTSTPSPASVQIKKGAKVELADVDWKGNQKTLVIYVRKGCRFCTESMPFYKTLAQKKADFDTKIIVASPDSTDISKGYLNENGVELETIHQANLSFLGVRGTPTLLLVNENGEVSNSWLGRLPQEKEKEVLSQL